MARRSPGLSGLSVLAIGTGLWLAYAGIRDVSPIGGLGKALRGQRPDERAGTGWTPATIGVRSTDSAPASGPAGRIVAVSGISGGVDASIAPAVGTLINRARHNANASLTGGGYRSSLAQAQLRRAHCCGDPNSSSCSCGPDTAPVGHSMHERGLAVDWKWNGVLITSRSSPGYQFLAANAPGLGLANLLSEPWHWSTNGT